MKNIILSLILISLILFTGCTLNPSVFYKIKDEYNFPHNIKVNSAETAMNWIYENIEYCVDYETWGVDDYWQSPEETYNLRRGDCEDFCILFAYFVYTQLDLEPILETRQCGNRDLYHIIVRINTTYYNVSANMNSIDFEFLHFVYNKTYEQALIKALFGK